MLASPSTGAGNRAPIDVRTLVATGHWVLDVKLDGIRAFMREGKLINRQGVDITRKFPEIEHGEHWLDGEIVAHDGHFETVATRDKLENPARIKLAAEANPCHFVAFDVPGLAFKGWLLRRGVLESIHRAEGIAITPISWDVEFMDQVQALGMEGVIAKRVDSRYLFGKRSALWVKHKFVQRISCLVYGYEPGKGARELGAMLIAVLGPDGKPVSVGKVGTGFTDKQATSMLARIKAKDVFIAEVECLSLTSGHTLRFPVFRGLRTDIDFTDCSTEQLESLPRSGG